MNELKDGGKRVDLFGHDGTVKASPVKRSKRKPRKTTSVHPKTGPPTQAAGGHGEG